MYTSTSLTRYEKEFLDSLETCVRRRRRRRKELTTLIFFRFFGFTRLYKRLFGNAAAMCRVHCWNYAHAFRWRSNLRANYITRAVGVIVLRPQSLFAIPHNSHPTNKLVRPTRVPTTAAGNTSTSNGLRQTTGGTSRAKGVIKKENPCHSLVFCLGIGAAHPHFPPRIRNKRERRKKKFVNFPVFKNVSHSRKNFASCKKISLKF